MALYSFVSHEVVDEDGREWLHIGPELEETPCARCGAEAFPKMCPGDGRRHHHGCVHTVGGGLEPVCGTCLADVKREWEEARK